MIKGDPGRIRQILTNLVGNAIKFTKKGEVVIRAGLTEIDSELIFTCSVTDTGVGIPQEKLDHLFDSFTQADVSTTREYGGTGLGLAIVRELAELMNGSIRVSSEEGKGSCFEFDLTLLISHAVDTQIPQLSYSRHASWLLTTAQQAGR
jgi:signal transduction histidine kinase